MATPRTVCARESIRSRCSEGFSCSSCVTAAANIAIHRIVGIYSALGPATSQGERALRHSGRTAASLVKRSVRPSPFGLGIGLNAQALLRPRRTVAMRIGPVDHRPVWLGRRSICLKISSDSNPVDAAGLGPALQSVPIEAPHRVDRALPAGAVNAANLTALSSS